MRYYIVAVPEKEKRHLFALCAISLASLLLGVIDASLLIVPLLLLAATGLRVRRLPLVRLTDHNVISTSGHPASYESVTPGRPVYFARRSGIYIDVHVRDITKVRQVTGRKELEEVQRMISSPLVRPVETLYVTDPTRLVAIELKTGVQGPLVTLSSRRVTKLLYISMERPERFVHDVQQAIEALPVVK